MSPSFVKESFGNQTRCQLASPLSILSSWADSMPAQFPDEGRPEEADHERGGDEDRCLKR
jgi:hypothetical protein